MDDQSASTPFRAVFESALRTYDEKTGIILAEHPLTSRFQNCRSVESINALLEDQLRASSDSVGNDRIMISIKSIISILSGLSATPALDWATGLVCQKALMACSGSLTVFLQTFSPENAIHASLAILLAVCVFLCLRYYADPCDIYVCQAANGIEASYDALIDLLESIEHFLRRLEIYTHIPHTTALDDMMVKIIMELLSTLALATKGLKRGRWCESDLVDVLHYSIERSEIQKETLWREGRRGSTAEVGPTHPR